MSMKRVYQFHKWSGLITGLFILLLTLTGSILVFHEELESLTYTNEWTVQNKQAVNIDKALITVFQKFPDWDIRLQRFSSDPAHSLIFQLRQPNARLIVFVHPSQGQILKIVDQKDSVVFWILKLHYSLHAGIIGECIVFLIGLLFILSLITGLIVYRKALVRTFTFKTKFLNKSRRSLASSLHRYIGVWALIFNLLMAITGTVISYEIVKSGLNGLKTPPVAELISSHPVPISMDSVLTALKWKMPAFSPAYIRFPTAKGKPIIIAGRVKNESFMYSKYYNTVHVNPSSGQVGALQLTKSLSSLVRGIHFIEYGNLWAKLFFCLVGMSGPVLSISGFLLWRWRRSSTGSD